MSLTTDAAALAPFVYVMATFAPSAARRFAIAAPMPREPPVMSATFSFNLDMGSPLLFCERFTPLIQLTAILLGPVTPLSDVPFLQVDLVFWGIPAIPIGNALTESRQLLESVRIPIHSVEE